MVWWCVWCVVFVLGGFRLGGCLCEVAMLRKVVDISLEYWVLMVVEREKIFSSALCSCSVWCWWRIDVRWDTRSRSPIPLGVLGTTEPRAAC